MSEALISTLGLLLLVIFLALFEGIGEVLTNSLSRERLANATLPLTGKGIFLYLAAWNTPVVYAFICVLLGWGLLPTRRLLALLCINTLFLCLTILASCYSIRLQKILYNAEKNTTQTRTSVLLCSALILLTVVVAFSGSLLIN